jgi:hypothetical protein
MAELYTPPEVSAPGLVPYINALGTNLVGCELGVCRGYNLRYLLDRAPNVAVSYAIDPWLAYQDWCEYVNQDRVNGWKAIAHSMLDPLGDRVYILEKNSVEAAKDIADDILDYIFIDGDHSYEASLRDCQLYWSKVKTGGIFAGHDWQLPAVTRAVTEFREQFGITTEIQFTESNVWFWYKT